MKAFLEDKDEAFAEAHQRALEWTDDFAVYAEKKCVETLQRVQREAQAHYDKQLLRQSLRLIRLPWAEKRAFSLMNRQKMRNLLRLCAGCCLGVRIRDDAFVPIASTRRHRRDAIDATLTGRTRRWRKVDRSMPNYWRLRTKYHCFLDWIRLVKNHKLYRTTSVKKMLLKRKHRAFASTRLLKERGARRCLCGNQNLWRVLPRPRRHLVDFHTGRCRSIHQDKWADVRATFSRWSTYAFDQIRWRQMTMLGTKRVRLKLLQKMFSVLKSEAGFGVISGRTPWVRRIDADLGVCSCVEINQCVGCAR